MQLGRGAGRAACRGPRGGGWSHTQLWEDPGAGFLASVSPLKYCSKIQERKARGWACPRGRERGRVAPSHRQGLSPQCLGPDESMEVGACPSMALVPRSTCLPDPGTSAMPDLGVFVLCPLLGRRPGAATRTTTPDTRQMQWRQRLPWPLPGALDLREIHSHSGSLTPTCDGLMRPPTGPGLIMLLPPMPRNLIQGTHMCTVPQEAH